MKHLTPPDIIIKDTSDSVIKEFLTKSLKSFYKELDLFCEKNDNYDFGDWFSESGFLSMLINGIIRDDIGRRFSAVQEYCVKNHIKGGSGRCDGFITFDRNVLLIEAKEQSFLRRVDENHFDIEKWIIWDEDEIRKQLMNYLHSEKKFFLEDGRYDSCYLMTIVFKSIKENSNLHRQKAQTDLNTAKKTPFDRSWYYSLSFLRSNEDNTESEGMEVYGTIEKI